ncbi:PilZ domain-containing protein [Desulfobacterales bacterium HSG2]|nr:PilZ domain-containing protein [Desulfobacterales bacterium HSG2]
MSKPSESKKHNVKTEERIAAALERIATSLEHLVILTEDSGPKSKTIEELLPLVKAELDMNIQEKNEEKRKHSRKPCSIIVDYATQDRSFRDYIRDISKGGVFIETTNFFSAGQEFIMTFSIPNQEKPFRFVGEVVRINERGVGVKFKKKVMEE